MLGCGDGSVYTGITNDVEKRMKAHGLGEGAKYTRGRGPFELFSLWETKTKSEDCKVEYNIKKKTKKKYVIYYRRFWLFGIILLPVIVFCQIYISLKKKNLNYS